MGAHDTSVEGRGEPAQRLRAAFTGRLRFVGLPAVLNLLEMERSSGLLVVRQAGAEARISVREGQVLRVLLEGATREEGLEAVRAILDWRAGHFEFRSGRVAEAEAGLGLSVMHLLMEAARRSDEAAIA